MYISRVFDQNGISLLYIIVKIYHSGQKPLILYGVFGYRAEALCDYESSLSVFVVKVAVFHGAACRSVDLFDDGVVVQGMLKRNRCMV